MGIAHLLRSLALTRRALITTVCCLAWPAWSACLPAPDAALPDAPYNGYTPTGYKGGLERDTIWHRSVRVLPQPDGTLRFALKQRPAAHYASIEPLHLGGRAIGFVATVEGCQQLLQRNGQPYALPRFEAVHPEWMEAKVLGGAGRTLLRLKSGEHYRLALFQRGRLLAVSPRDYLSSYNSSTLEANRHYLPAQFRPVVSADGHGLIDLRKLKEVLQPEWLGVGGLSVLDDPQAASYLLSDSGEQRRLYALPSGKLLMDRIASLTPIPNWFPYRPGHPAGQRAVLLLHKQGEAGCQLLNWQLQPLMPHLLPLRHGQCQLAQFGERRYLFSDADMQSVHAYAILAEGALRWISTTPGQLEAAEANTGLMVLRVSSEQETRYRLYFADGRPASTEYYTGFTDLGCGFWRVKQGATWLSLSRDGQTSPQLRYPFSC